jgi:preprotein translocase subunit SecE
MGWLDKIRSFLGDVRGELKRTTFPSAQEVRGTTTVVIITVFIFAFFLWVVDTILFKMVDWIFKVAG